MNKNFRPTILIDLDGVLNNYSKFEEDKIPPIRKGAKEFLEKLYKDYDLILFTTRNPLLASKWVIENEIDGYFKNISNVKVPAMLHLDDRAVCFRGDFEKAFEEVRDFRVYWK